MSPVLHFKRRALFWVMLGAFIPTVWFVNPYREASIRDEWAYAQTVQHLLATGQYEWNQWAAANMPFQAYYGELFARLFGFSFSSLRISTLTLSLIGLIAFNSLAREHGMNEPQADLLTLCLFVSPLFLHFSLNFMTDLPFLTCLIVALLFYTRAIRLHSYPLMILASVAACAAILTRQFGMALIAGLSILWTVSKQRGSQALFFLCGLILPIIAVFWQLSAGLLAPNWAARGLRYFQVLYFEDIGLVFANILWRLIEILQYLALSFLPLVFLALLALVAEIRRNGFKSLFTKWSVGSYVTLFGLLAAYIFTGLAFTRFANELTLRIPYLEGSLDDRQGLSGFPLVCAILTPVTLVGAFLFARIFLLRYSGNKGWKSLPPSEHLLDFATFFLLLFHLIYVNFADEYLLVLLPFALIVLGRHLQGWLNRMNLVTAAACLVILAASAAWTRAALDRSQAYWDGGEFARSIGMSPRQIYGSWEWVSSYRFLDYVTEAGDRGFSSDYLYDLTGDYFLRWLPEQKKASQIWVTEGVPSQEEWFQILRTIPYKDILLRHRNVSVARRWIGQADYWFAKHLNSATIETPRKDTVTVTFFWIKNSLRPVMYEHPSSRIAFRLKLPQEAYLCFGLGLNPETWSPDKGDGVEFEVLVQDGNSSQKVFSKYIDPKQNITDRRWHDEVVDLSRYGGKEVSLSFVTTPGYQGNDRFDWAGWSNPRIATNSEELKYEPVK